MFEFNSIYFPLISKELILLTLFNVATVFYAMNTTFKSQNRNCKRNDCENEDDKHLTKKSRNLDGKKKFVEPFVDTEDLTFQSSPSPDSSEIEYSSLKNPIHPSSSNLSFDSFSNHSKFSSIQNFNPRCDQNDLLTSRYSQTVASMMHKMGYKVSKGLGLEEQGITAPVEYKSRFGRAGIGFSTEIDKFHIPKNELIFSLKGKWISCPNENIIIPQFSIHTTSKSQDILDAAYYIDSNVLSQLIKCKSLLDIYHDREDFLSARIRFNPFETIGKGIFLNRAAMKMANIDAMLDYLLTDWSQDYSPIDIFDKDIEKTPFYFADLCAGPGGFSEYILYRLGFRAKGFGFTLRGDCDFKFDDFLAGTPETFEPNYGILGDGDITKNENIISFQKYVFEVSNKSGVSLVMGDGGFSVKGQENNQEIMSKQLIMCQIICATSILKEGGNFICKTFDIFTPFSFNLLYLMFISFRRISILKPCTSRPANSERYLVCNGFRLKEGKEIFSLLLGLNTKINQLKSTGEEVSNFMPSAYKYPTIFNDYIISLNNRLAKVQIIALKKILSHITEGHQKTVFHEKMKCFSLYAWHVPNIPRSTFKIKQCNPNIYFEEFCRRTNITPFSLSNSAYSKLSCDNLDNLSEIYSWYCFPIYGLRLILLSLGRENVFYWNCQNVPASFSHIRNIIDKKLEIPSRTILEVMLIDTYSSNLPDGEFLGTQLWIMDIYAIANYFISDWPRSRKIKLIKHLYQVIHKPLMNHIAMRPILSFELTDLPNLLQSLCSNFSLDESGAHPRLKLIEDCYVPFQGFFFIRTIRYPWISRRSKTHKKNYYFNTKTNVSSFDFPSDASLDLVSSLKSRIVWSWDASNNDLCALQYKNEKETCSRGVLCIPILSEFINKRL